MHSQSKSPKREQLFQVRMLMPGGSAKTKVPMAMTITMKLKLGS